MSKIGLVLILTLLAGKSHAQDYFILVQADNNQPFYILMGDKSFSSSAQGHLILSQLKEGDHTITIGFPGKIFPEQQYTISIQKTDLELQLKDQGEKGWGLFNPRSLELRMPDKKKAPAAGAGPEGVKKDDAFSRLMAGVVSDTAVMYNTYAMEQVLKDSPVAAVNTTAGAGALTGQVDTPGSIKDTVRAQTAPDPGASVSVTPVPGSPVPVTPTPAVPVPALDSSRATPPALASGQTAIVKTARTLDTDTAAQVADTSAAAGASRPHKNSIVAKLSERKTSRSWRGVYTDRMAGRKADTIVVIIPVDTVRPATVQPALTGAQGGEEGRVAAEPGEKKVPVRLVVANSDCRNFATDYDVDKLRVKMLEVGKDDDRIANARKVFRTKCFTTRQIKALSEVFTTDAVKYRFLETAYPFVSDDRFGELAALLTDPVYNSKFKAMTGQQ